MAYKELRERFNSNAPEVLSEAAAQEMTFQQFANAEAPEIMMEQKRSAVAALWQDEGLFARTTPMSKATRPSLFFENEKRQVLMYDYLQRRFNTPEIGKRNSLTTGFEDAVGSLLYPGTGGTPRVDQQYTPPIDVNETIAQTMDITGTTYRPFRWEYKDNQDALERQPVAPGAPVEVITLGQKEDAIQLQKWGNAFNLTYEALAEFSAGIDKLGNMIALEGLREQARLLNQIVDKLVNGDGTAGSAAEVVNQSTLKSGANTGELNADAWLAMRYQFEAPYWPTHALMRDKTALELELLATGSSNIHISQLINISAAGISAIEPMNQGGKIRYGRVEAAPQNRIVWLDARFGLEQVNMSGADMQEQATNILNQTRQIVITNTLNFAKLDFDATKVMNLAA